MSSIVQTIQKSTTLLQSSKQSLPLSTPAAVSDDQQPSLRRRLSSLSLNLQPAAAIAASPAARSLSSMGGKASTSIKQWWTWGWAWILSRKPNFAQDLEMNEEEKLFIGSQNRGSLIHIFYKVKSEVRKLLRYDDMSLPQTLSYNSSNSGFKRTTLG